MHERTRSHFCPIVLNDPAIEELQETYPLFTQFLNPTRAASKDGTSRFAIAIALYEFPVEQGKIDYSSQIHGIPNWADQLLVDVKLSGKDSAITYSWASEKSAPETDLSIKNSAPKGWSGSIPLPPGRAIDLLGPGARLDIEAYPWTID